VSLDCLVSFRGNRYSVPWTYAGQTVMVKVSRGKDLIVLDMDGNAVATHELCRQKGRTLLKDEHYEGLRKNAPRTRALLEQVFLERFPGEMQFLKELYKEQKTNIVAHLRNILTLSDIYPEDVMHLSFSLAHQQKVFSASFIRGICE